MSRRPDQSKLDDVKYRRRLRLDVLKAYGGDPPTCACCGETTLEFLNVDHVNGGGHEQRRQLFGKNVGSRFYQWLRSNDYPPGYRVLCSNCNSSMDRGKSRCRGHAMRVMRLDESEVFVNDVRQDP